MSVRSQRVNDPWFSVLSVTYVIRVVRDLADRCQSATAVGVGLRLRRYSARSATIGSRPVARRAGM